MYHHGKRALCRSTSVGDIVADQCTTTGAFIFGKRLLTFKYIKYDKAVAAADDDDDGGIVDTLTSEQ